MSRRVGPSLKPEEPILVRVRPLRKQERARLWTEPLETVHRRTMSSFKKEHDHVLKQEVFVRVLVLGLVWHGK